MDGNTIFNLLLINLMILIVPGVNCLVIANTALMNGKKAAFIAVLGFTTGIMTHVLLSALGVSVILKNNLLLFNIIKVLGTIYIVVIASSFLVKSMSKKSNCNIESINMQKNINKGFFKCLLIDILNPMMSIFYLHLFLAINTQDIPKLILGIFIMTIAWFSFVAFIFSRKLALEFYLKYTKILSLMSGICLLYFAYKLFNS